MENRPDGGLLQLISLYEGFTHAFCQVLEKDMDEIKAQIPPDFIKKLAEEMGVGDWVGKRSSGCRVLDTGKNAAPRGECGGRAQNIKLRPSLTLKWKDIQLESSIVSRLSFPSLIPNYT